MFVAADDALLYTVSFGSKSAPAILGIGGWIGSWELWAEPFSLLSRRWHTLAYDHRGSGATVAPPQTITFDALVDDVFRVLDAHGVGRCVLAAESAGAVTALGAALKHPERFTGLVLVDGMYFRDRPLEQDPFRAGMASNYPATLDRFVAACIPDPDLPHVRRWGRQILDRASQESAVALYTMAGSVDLRPDLVRVAQPTLVIHGENDLIVPVESSRRLVEVLPNAKLHVLKGAGHVPTLTHADEIAGRIEAFFAAG